MYEARVRFDGLSEMLFGAPIVTAKKDSETADQHEKRVWHERARITSSGQVYLQGTAVTQGLESAAKFLGRKIPGEGKKTYTQRFKSGVLATEDIMFFNPDDSPLKRDDLEGKWLFVPSDGTRGSGRRVWRCFPSVNTYYATFALMVLDNKIDEKQLTDHLVAMGRFIGWGSMRVERGNPNGRTKCADVQIEEIAE